MAGFVCEERLTFGPWPALERMLARLVEHAGFHDVAIVGGSGDDGADVVASRGRSALGSFKPSIDTPEEPTRPARKTPFAR